VATDNFVAAMITTARRSTWPLDVEIAEWESVGLSYLCVVRMKLFTIASVTVRNQLGRIGAPSLDLVEQSLAALLIEGSSTV